MGIVLPMKYTVQYCIFHVNPCHPQQERIVKGKHFEKAALSARAVLSVFDQTTIESLARETGFIQRKRKISGFSFFLALICGLVPCAAPSLESICLSLQVLVSRQAVSKRFNRRAVAFMKACLQLQLTRIASLTESAKLKLARFPRVIVLDSTQWQLNPALKKWFQGSGGGASQAACKLQTAFEFISGKILLMDFHRATRPDQGYGKNILRILHPGDLILMDLGYYSISLFTDIQQRAASFICPVYYHSAVNKQDSQKTSVADVLEKVEFTTFDSQFLIGSTDKMNLRLVAFRNSPQKADKLRRKLKEDYRKHGRGQPPQKRLLFCNWTALITNVAPSQLCTQDVLQAYRSRWHIEIFFRDAKSHLNLDASPSAKRERFEVQLLAILIVAALLCFVQGRFNLYSLEELSLEKLIKRFAQRSALLLECLRTKSFHLLQDIFLNLLTYSIKFHQPSRKTPRQNLAQVCFLS